MEEVFKYKKDDFDILPDRFTQTGTNSQDVSYIVITAEKLRELSDLTYEILNQKGKYILANLTPETEYLKKYAML